MRNFNRKKNELRQIKVEKNYIQNSLGSCLISYGKTKVICTANYSTDLPQWLKKEKHGWLTAEYSMLPGSTDRRSNRESKNGKQSGRTIEIQRLIGRSLRTIIDLDKIKDLQFIVDCDVIEADGGTRTASITGSFISLFLAVERMLKDGIIKENPIKDYIAGISCGVLKGEIFVDLDYSEDSAAEVDANFIFTEKSGIAEIQISGEQNTYDFNAVEKMIKNARKAVDEIFKIQKDIISQ
ncbi:MAG: ribonuclease PH [Rickettsiales bacterium]|nr:ribonuclease PH [Rickettsiales bacterium]